MQCLPYQGRLELQMIYVRCFSFPVTIGKHSSSSLRLSCKNAKKFWNGRRMIDSAAGSYKIKIKVRTTDT